MRTKKPLCLALILFLSAFICQAVYAADATIVVVKTRNIGPYNSAASAFKKELLSRGGSLKIIELDMEGKDNSAIAGQVKNIKPDLALTLGTQATKAIRSASLGIPIVYAMVLKPEESNISPPGVDMDIPLELKLREFKRIAPNAKKVGVIYCSMHSPAQASFQRLGFELVSKKVSSQKEFPSALDEVFSKVDCFLMVADPDIYLPKTVEFLLLQSLQKKIPVIGLSSAYAKAGALVAFDCDYADMGRQSAELVLKVLNKEGPSLNETLYPRRVTLSLNLMVAQRLGIDVPESMIKEASEVYGR